MSARRVVVISPHLDDAVFSLGGAIARPSAAGLQVRVVTVLAGDPSSQRPAGPWDAACGFATVGAAARERRAEDARACRLLGARPVWPPFADQQYPPAAPDDRVAEALAAAVRGADLALGYPLQQGDHARVARLAQDCASPDGRGGLYLEQPYAVGSASVAPVAPRAAGPAAEPGWAVVRLSERDRRAKRRACARYRSQRRMLGPHWYRHVSMYERSRGGETVAWPGQTPL